MTKNFQLSEFACNDGTPVPPELVTNCSQLAEQLQVLRDELKESITINSGYRSKAWNKKVGGKPNSMHLQAKAADIVTASKTPKQLKAWKALAESFGTERYALEWCSYREAAEAGVKAMQAEADKLLENPSVRKAYERFLLVAALTKDHS
jgi:hypothetical protein